MKFVKDEEESRKEIRSKAKFAKRDSLLFSRTYTITYMVWVWEDIQKKKMKKEKKTTKKKRVQGLMELAAHLNFHDNMFNRSTN